MWESGSGVVEFSFCPASCPPWLLRSLNWPISSSRMETNPDLGPAENSSVQDVGKIKLPWGRGWALPCPARVCVGAQ